MEKEKLLENRKRIFGGINFYIHGFYCLIILITILIYDLSIQGRVEKIYFIN
mgnify:CR=1 FL=1